VAREKRKLAAILAEDVVGCSAQAASSDKVGGNRREAPRLKCKLIAVLAADSRSTYPAYGAGPRRDAGEPDTTHRLIVDDPIISLSGRIPSTAGDSVKDAIEIATKAVGLDSPRLS
jgi:hypothetical protein